VSGRRPNRCRPFQKSLACTSQSPPLFSNEPQRFKPLQSSLEVATIDGSTDNRHDMPSFFLTFRCRQCQEGRCVSAIWWDIRAINELKDKDFSARCPDCGHQDVFFGIEAIEMYHGELSAIERMELDEEELREFGLDEEGEREE
jgi:ribosomal protein S27E